VATAAYGSSNSLSVLLATRTNSRSPEAAPSRIASPSAAINRPRADPGIVHESSTRPLSGHLATTRWTPSESATCRKLSVPCPCLSVFPGSSPVRPAKKPSVKTGGFVVCGPWLNDWWTIGVRQLVVARWDSMRTLLPVVALGHHQLVKVLEREDSPCGLRGLLLRDGREDIRLVASRGARQKVAYQFRPTFGQVARHS
jgi:hypothetical protein